MKSLEAKTSKFNVEKVVKTEIAIMKTLDNPYIVKLHEALEDDATRKIYLVMEFCSRGCLMSEGYWRSQMTDKEKANTMLITLNKSIPLIKAKHYLRQTAEGLYYCRFALMQCTMS